MLIICDFAVILLKKSKLKTKVSVLQKQDTDFDFKLTMQTSHLIQVLAF